VSQQIILREDKFSGSCCQCQFCVLCSEQFNLSSREKRMMSKFKGMVAAVFAATLVFGFAAPAGAATAEPDVVLDNAELFSAEQEVALKDEFERVYDSSDVVFVLQTVPNLEGRDIQTVAATRATELGVGEADKNNGVFALLSRDDREIYFSLGSGIGAKVSGQDVDNITAADVLPSFRDGDYFTGITSGVNSIAEAYTGTASDEAAVSGSSSAASAIGSVVLTILGLGLIIFVAFATWDGIQRHKRRKAKKAMLAEQRIRDEKKRVADEAKQALIVLETERIQVITKSVDKLINNEATLDEFMKAADKSARKLIVAAALSEYLEKDMEFAPRSYDKFEERYLDLLSHTLKKANQPRGHLPKLTLRADSSTSFLSQLDRWKREARTAVLAEQKRVKKAAEEKARIAREAAAVRERQAREKAEAKQFWSKLEPTKQAAVKQARSKAKKQELLQQYGASSSDLAVWMPLFVSMYASSFSTTPSYGSSSSSSSSSSHRSSSSSSSSSGSYSSPSYDSSSYGGGGGFDSGGGGGW